MEKTTTIFGVHPVIEALKSNESIEKILMLKGSSNQEILGLARDNNIGVSFVPQQKFRKYQSKNHQGVVAFLSPITYLNFEETITSSLQSNNEAVFLLLDGITDVRNVGSILRTAECTGVSAIIFPQQGSARINEDMIKTSAGAIFNIPICKVNHIKDAIYFLQSSGINVIGASEKAEQSLFNVELKKPLAIVMGSEGSGIQKGVLKLLDDTYSIPLHGKTQSLNVSVAAALFLYEVLR